MKTKLKGLSLSVITIAVATGYRCGPSGPPPKVAPPTAVEQLQSAAKKVDFAIASTKEMIQRSRGATYMPDMYMRLAELYSDRARFGWLIVFENRRARHEEGRVFDAPEARLLKNLAIGVYDRLTREFPRYARNDEALFFMAHEYRELGDFAQMQKTYEKLISTYPKSPHRFEAYLVLGDAAFDKSLLDQAEKYYNFVLAEPTSKVHSLARYKLAWVRINREDCKGAVRLFEQILRDKNTPKGTQTLVATQRKLNLTREALVDIAYCYPDVYAQQPPSPYFKGLASSSSDYIAAMRRAGGRFFIKQMFAQSAAALREVLDAANSDEDAVETARKLYDNLQKSRNYDNAPGDVRRLARVLEQREYDFRIAPEARQKLAVEFEVYARDVATKAQLFAKEKKTQQTYAVAAAAYNEYLNYFPNSASANDLKQNLAESLLLAGKHYEAARSYEKVVEFVVTPDAKQKAVTNAVAEYQSALEGGQLNRVERAFSRGGIRSIGRQFIAQSPADVQVVKVKMAIARSYYESGDYRRSAELFYAIQRQYPTTEEGQVGAQLALDALRLADDFEGLVTLGRRLIADQRLPAGLRSEIAGIVAKTEQRQIAELTILASGEDREENLIQFAKRNRGNAGGEQALYNMMVVAKEGGDSGKFYDIGREYLEEYPKSQRRADVLRALSATASDRGDFEPAALFLEQLYDAEPSAKDAADHLQAAATIHAFIGDAKVAADVKRLVGFGNPQRLDELLDIIARSGNLAGLEEIVTQNAIDTPTADFLRGYFAYQRGDKDEATRFLVQALKGRAQSPVSLESQAKAKLLLGELAYERFENGASSGNDIAKLITDKQALLAATDKSFAQVISGREPTWALSALGRLSDAYARYGAFMQSLQLPEGLSADEEQQLRKIIAARAEEAKQRAAEFRALCAKRTTELVVFSDVTRACLTNQPLPDKVAMFAQAPAKNDGAPQAAADLRQKLLKKPKDAELLAKLAELYLGASDLGLSLLILEKAEEVDPRSSAVHNLRAVALHRAGDAQGAYAEWQKALELDPSNLLARANLATQYAIYGFSDKAKAEAKKVGVFLAKGEPNEHPSLSELARLTQDEVKK